MLIITDDISSFEVSTSQAIDLELKLNVTEYGRKWITIGDKLYDFGARNSMLEKLYVTTQQYEFLLMLKNKSGWESCRGL